MANIQPRTNKSGKIISYSIRVHKGRDMNGKQLKPYTMTWIVPEGWNKSRIEKAVQAEAVLFEEKCKKGIVADNKQSFEKYAHYVIDLKERTGIKHRTIIGYRNLMPRIAPAIGHIKLADLRPQHLNSFYEQLSKDGMNLKTGKKLSAKTILEYHSFIRAVLSNAEKESLVIFNVARKATPPKVTHKEANFLEEEVIKNVLFYLNNEPKKWQAAMQLLIFTGCRRGEIMGLKWNKINFKDCTIRIEANLLYTKEKGIFSDTTKTESSKRTIKIPQETINILKSYKKECNAKRLSLGSHWHDTDFVFVQEDGKPMHPDSLTDYCVTFRKRYNKIIKKENLELSQNNQIKLLPRINPHSFRHSQASLLFFNGADAITISKRLGHAKVSTTSLLAFT
jgi:integrase